MINVQVILTRNEKKLSKKILVQNIAIYFKTFVG